MSQTLLPWGREDRDHVFTTYTDALDPRGLTLEDFEKAYRLVEEAAYEPRIEALWFVNCPAVYSFFCLLFPESKESFSWGQTLLSLRVVPWESKHDDLHDLSNKHVMRPWFLFPRGIWQHEDEEGIWAEMSDGNHKRYRASFAMAMQMAGTLAGAFTSLDLDE